MLVSLTRGITVSILFFLVALSSSQAHAQATRVNVMPGAPNFPRTDPHPARPGATTLVWGNANGGDGSANGDTYVWSFVLPGNVTMAPAGPLSGAVTDDKFICEEVVFSLTSGTQGTVSATLQVGGGAGPSDTVLIQVIDPTDPISTPDAASLQIDVNIAIENALRRLYLMEASGGGWQTSAFYTTAETGFPLWAFGNKGHRASTPANPNTTASHGDDIYAETMQRGLDYLFSIAAPDVITAANATIALGAVANGVSDINSNGRSINLAPGSFDQGYETPIATAGIIACQDPTRIVTVGPFAGQTYRSIVEDCVDWTGSQQNSAPPTGPRGGWTYNGPNTYSDMSVNSWHYTALEGAEFAFGIAVPDWIKQEAEYALVFHQNNAAGAQPFGYTSTNPLISWPNLEGRSTTGGGLSGLVFVETGGTAGSVISTAAAPLNTIASKRTAALDYLGAMWNDEVDNQNLGSSNHGNFYTMWTCARSLRLTAMALSLPTGQKVPLTNGGFTFDWEFGTETPGAPGNVPGFGLAAAAPLVDREGYFNYLVRKQDNSNANKALRGQWDESTFMSNYGDSFETSLGVLVLIPKVFDVRDCLEIKSLRVDCPPASDPTGDFTISFDVQNNSGVDVHHMVLPPNTTVPGAPVTVSPNVLNFSPPIPDGGSRPVVLTISGASPGDQVCFLVSLADVDFEQCCADEICIDLPTCDCVELIDENLVCEPDGAGGFTFRYDFTIQNLTGQVMDHVFLAGSPTLPSGLSFSPDSFLLGGLPDGGTATLSTTISGASPGQVFCFQLTIHDETLLQCCSIEVCLCLPDCPVIDPCLENFQCEVQNGSVVITWTPPGMQDDCCFEVEVTTPDGSVFFANAFSGSFTVPAAPCLPGEYCIRCIPGPGNPDPPQVECCTISDEDCFPDPCITDFSCSVGPAGLRLTWTLGDPACCENDAVILLDGVPIGSVNPASGNFLTPDCLPGTYCLQCDSAVFGLTERCCTIDVNCGLPNGDPHIASVPVLIAEVGVEYFYDAEGYDPEEADSLTYSLNGPASAMIDPDTGVVTWSPTPADLGAVFDFAITVMDNNMGSGRQDYQVTVQDAQPEPTVRGFRRGDCNVDGVYDIADGVRVLAILFDGGGLTAACEDACDPNDSNAMDIGDAVFVFAGLFSNGPAPAAPYPDCGLDPSRDGDVLGCESYDSCP